VHVLANEAVRAGYDGIEHINMLFLNFLATHDTDTRDTTRFSLVGDKAADLDLASQPVTDFLDLLAAHHTVIDPTLGAFEDLFVGEAGKITPGLASIVSRMPIFVQRGYLENGLGDMTPEKHARYLAAWRKLLAMVVLVHQRGIPEVAGTDTVAGLGLLHELALLVQAGLTPADAIAMATLDSAKVLGTSPTSGSIEVGKIADLVVIDGNPLGDITDLERVVTTVKAGVSYDSAALYETVGVTSARAKR
jgi:imidazolonepropionase-like amidohydrolase